MKKINLLYLISLVFLFAQCNEVEEYSLPGTLPADPDFTIDPVPDDPNRFIVTDNSTGNFTRLWDFGPDGLPKTSSLQQDTVTYSKKGDYTIRLHISASDGSGTANSEQSVFVAEDGVLACSETLEVLTNNCTQKCWRFSEEAGAVAVGPEPLSGEWFTSNGLEPTQLDDLWCINIEDGIFDYQNQGSSFSACQGYVEDVNYPVPVGALFEYIPGGGIDGLDRITLLTPGSWMGVEDSGPTYDIFSVTSSRLVLIAPLFPCDGSPSTGFFTFTFKAEE